MKQPINVKVSWSYIGAALAAFALLAGAIVSTSSVAQLSYQAAQLQARETALNEQKQYLQEQLAAAHSLSQSLTYAQEQGFSQGTQYQAQLDVTPSLAQAR